MKLLLDTATLLWWLTASPRLSTRASDAVATADEVFVSAASAWEIATRHRLGKLPGAEPVLAGFGGLLERAGLKSLPIDPAHGLRAGSYAAGPADPFDRLLAAQAEVEGLVLVTADPVFAGLPVETLW